MKLRIILKSGAVIEMDVPDDFQFTPMCLQVVASGYFHNGMIHIAYDAIESMLLGDAPVKFTPAGTTLQ